MTIAEEPPRLRTGEGSTELALALASSREEEATAVELEQLRAAVARSVAPRDSGVTHWRARRPAPARGALGLALTFAVGAGAGVAVSGGVLLVEHLAPRNEPVGVTARAAPSASSNRAPSRGSVPPSLRAAPAATEAQAPVLAPLAPPVTPRHEPSAPTAPAVAPSAGGSKPTPWSERSSTASHAELALLAQAQAALRTDPQRTLTLVSEHERSFPQGSLIQEREVLAIDALTRLGRASEAQARGASFRSHFPGSAHERRVDVLLGERGGDHK